MQFLKYHALGNDYLIVPRTEELKTLSVEQIQLICHRNFGLGSDGILLEATPFRGGDFALRIFNPDGSEAEKSGNGLRIFARYLFDHELVRHESFTIETIGGKVTCQVLCPEEKIVIEMGAAVFNKEGVLAINNQPYPFFSVSIGNPHCVIPVSDISENLIKKIGPQIEHNALFPNRTNVQLMKILDRNNIQIEIWERGAGYTLASGSSASASAAIAYKIGQCDQQITVHMPGGNLKIDLGPDYYTTMTGPTTFVGQFKINNALLLKKNLASLKKNILTLALS